MLLTGASAGAACSTCCPLEQSRPLWLWILHRRTCHCSLPLWATNSSVWPPLMSERNFLYFRLFPLLLTYHLVPTEKSRVSLFFSAFWPVICTHWSDLSWATFLRPKNSGLLVLSSCVRCSNSLIIKIFNLLCPSVIFSTFLLNVGLNICVKQTKGNTIWDGYLIAISLCIPCWQAVGFAAATYAMGFIALLRLTLHQPKQWEFNASLRSQQSTQCAADLCLNGKEISKVKSDKELRGERCIYVNCVIRKG